MMNNKLITRWLSPSGSANENVRECDECKYILDGSGKHKHGCRCNTSTKRNVQTGNNDRTNLSWAKNEIARMKAKGDSVVQIITDGTTGKIALAR